MDLRSVLNRVPGPVKRAVKNALYPDLLEVGSAAPNWTLRAHDGTEHTLPEHGWAVLVFYPADDTPGCTMQLAEFQRNAEALNALGVRVFGVNPASATDHTAFANKCGLSFPLLVDDGARVAALHGCALQLPIGTRVIRTVYLVDGHGRVRMAERGFPSLDTVLAIVRPSGA